MRRSKVQSLFGGSPASAVDLDNLVSPAASPEVRAELAQVYSLLGLLPIEDRIAWTLRKRLRKDIGWPSDWEDGCKEVTRYFENSPLGGQEWAPWANYEFEKG